MRFAPACLLLLPLPLLAQTSSPSSSPPPQRYYVGLDASYQAARTGFGWQGQGLAPTLVAGRWLKPRLALQLGLTPSQHRYENHSEWVDNSTYDRPFPIYARYHTRLRTLALPLLVRYELRGRPERRLQVHALGGFTLQASHQLNQTQYADSTRTVYKSEAQQYTGFTVLLTAGPGLRYRLGPQVELTADAQVHVPLSLLPWYGVFGMFGTSSTLALGARYTLPAR
ncbi:porin family protein [Hymenobacter tenuis]